MRILVVEDDPSTSRSIELMLRSAGYECRVTGLGEDGVALALSTACDIVLVDLMLPDMDGYEVIRRLRAAAVNVPILILSGLAGTDDKLAGFGIGADDYLTKPFDRRELVARIEAILRRVRQFPASIKPAALTSVLLARKGTAAPWSFAMSYAPGDGLGGDATPTAASRLRVANGLSMAGSSGAAPAAVAALRPWRPLPHDCRCRVIVTGNMKGGTGKSTTAMHLIVSLLRQGHDVASVDLDGRQGSLSRYIENRRATTDGADRKLPLPNHRSLAVETDGVEALPDLLAQLAGAADYVVVDTPGSDNALSRLAHRYADVLVTPINDSFMDLDVLALVEAESLRILQPSLYSRIVAEAAAERLAAGSTPTDWVVLRNRLTPFVAHNKKNMADVLQRLALEIGFRQGPGLSERVIYREMFLSGLTLLDLGKEPAGVNLTLSHVAARQELRALFKSLRLDRPAAKHDLSRGRPPFGLRQHADPAA